MQQGQFANEFMTKRKMLYAFTYSLVRDHHLAEDIFQEVAAVAFEKSESFEPGTNLGAWLREIARRRIMKMQEKAKRLTVIDPDTIEIIDAAYGRLDNDVWDERKDALEKCRAKLREQSRRLLNLRYEDNLSFDEMAQQLQSTPNSVQVMLFKIREALRHCVNAALARSASS